MLRAGMRPWTFCPEKLARWERPGRHRVVPQAGATALRLNHCDALFGLELLGVLPVEAGVGDLLPSNVVTSGRLFL
jgi:hypothetical protein